MSLRGNKQHDEAKLIDAKLMLSHRTENMFKWRERKRRQSLVWLREKPEGVLYGRVFSLFYLMDYWCRCVLLHLCCTRFRFKGGDPRLSRSSTTDKQEILYKILQLKNEGGAFRLRDFVA